MTQSLIPDDTSPAEAFDAMSRRLAGLIASVDGFAARQQELLGRDYSEDLARIDERCTELRQALATMSNRPAMALTPQIVGEQIERAARATRETDQLAWHAAQRALYATIGEMTQRIDSARTADRQNWWLIGLGCAALVVGFLFGGTIPSIIDHAAPDQWHWPEARAAAVLRRDGWDAGERMMQVADPDRWNTLVAEHALWQGNADALADCRKSAIRKGKPVTCRIQIVSPKS